MTTKETTTNFVVVLQLPDDTWTDLETFAFFDEADDFASGITIGETKIFERTTVIEVARVEVK